MPQQLTFTTSPQFELAEEFDSDTRLVAAKEEAEDYSESEDTDWYSLARRLRVDPTIAMARSILAFPTLGRTFSFVGNDTSTGRKAQEILEKVLKPHLSAYLEETVFACIDYGWAACEVQPYKKKIEGVYHFGYQVLRHEDTFVVVNRKNGRISGALHYPGVNLESVVDSDFDPVSVRFDRFCLANSQTEYANPYGRAVLKNTVKPNERYETADEGSNRYLQKSAGQHWLITFPTGQTEVPGEGLVDNSIIARRIMSSMRSSSHTALPLGSESISQLLGNTGATRSDQMKLWNIELIANDVRFDPFLENKRFYDSQKMRALLLAERIATEGQFGTKAEASEHADISLVVIQGFGQGILNSVNKREGIIRTILKFHGIEWYPGLVELQGSPLADDVKQFMRELIRTVVNGEVDFATGLDFEELARVTNVPVQADRLAKVYERLENREVNVNQNPNPNLNADENPESGDSNGSGA